MRTNRVTDTVRRDAIASQRFAIAGLLNRAPATRTHTITGERDEVVASLRTLLDAGRLVDQSLIHSPVVLPTGQVQVTVSLREPTLARRIRWDVIGKVVLAALVAGVAGLAIWGVVYLVMALIAAVTATVAAISAAVTATVTWFATYWGTILAVLVGLFLLAVFCGGGSTSKCGGFHCGGCRH